MQLQIGMEENFDPQFCSQVPRPKASLLILITIVSFKATFWMVIISYKAVWRTDFRSFQKFMSGEEHT